MVLLGGFLADYQRVRFGSMGMLVWGTVTAVFFLLGLLYYAQYVIPLRGSDGWSEGFNLLMRYIFNRKSPPPQPRPSNKQKVPQKPSQERVPASFSIIDAGLIRGQRVLAVANRELFSRPAGPGFVILRRGENILGFIDLRPHQQVLNIRANTRDGIPIETAVTVTFRVKQEEPDDSDDVSNLSSDAIFKVSSYASVDENGRIQPWTKQLLPSATALLNQELSNYTLDELQQPGLPPLALDEVKQRVRQKLQQEADKNGIEVLAINVAPFEYPDSITEQRIKGWQAEWQRKIEVKHALGDAEATRRIKQARARSQIEMIGRITESIEVMRQQGDANLNEIITLRMIEALEEAMAEGSAQALIPQQVMTRLVMDASHQMQTWMLRSGGDAPAQGDVS